MTPTPILAERSFVHNTTRCRFSNGLTLLLRQQHKAPVISFWMLYRIGSRNEPTGKTGISHWVEHMLFKGTDKFGQGVLDKAIDRLGGSWNAQTSFDYTAYYETMPADSIDLALELEADRMINAKFDPDAVASERTVIISERQGGENSPSFWVSEAFHAAAFSVHGYHHKIIGDEVDLRSMTRDDLYNHYRTYYAPSNAIIALVGDFETEPMLAKLEALYGGLPSQPQPSAFVRPEPPQQGERRITVERHGGGAATYLSGYRVPAISHPDWLPLFLLDSILGGASIPGGGGAGNRTSRLYKALVRTEIAASVSCGMSETIDPYLFSFSVVLREGRTHAEAEAALEAEIAKVLAGDIAQAELDRASKQTRALFAYSAETVTNQAFRLAFFEHVAGDFAWFETLPERLAAITLEDLTRVARQYLRPNQRTVTTYIPLADEQTEQTEPDTA
jgi:zinc protease